MRFAPCSATCADPVQQHRLFEIMSGAAGSGTAGSGAVGSGTPGRARPALLLMSADEASSGRDGCLPPPAAPLLRKPFLAEALLDAAEVAVRQTGRAFPAQAGVRDEPPPCPDLLATPFRTALRDELGQLDREVTEGRWQAARDTLHRLRGAAAMCGFGSFAEACRRLAESIANEQPGWTTRYLELLRSGEDTLDGP